MVILRYDDPSMPEGFRYTRLNSKEEALAQAAHDQARDGTDLSVELFEAVESDEGFTPGKKIALGTLDADTATERERLELLMRVEE